MKWKTVRVFISSTFDDMQSERDQLVKCVFPVLRERLEACHVNLIDVDLRWGITADEADKNTVLDLCYEAIDSCRPFFIGILAERYGHVLSSPQTSTKKTRIPSIKTIGEYSITDLEFRYALLPQQQNNMRAFFYFRDPRVVRQIPCAHISSAYIEKNKEYSTKLNELKEFVRNSDAQVRDVYPAEWCSTNSDDDNSSGRIERLDEFCNTIISDLYGAIQEELDLPISCKDIEDSPHSVEDQAHENIIQSLLLHYVPRNDIETNIQIWLDSEYTEHCALCGSIGTGKSSALASAYYNNAHSNNNTVYIYHHIGATQKSELLKNVLFRYYRLLNPYLDKVLSFTYSEDTQGSICQFLMVISNLPQSKRFVLFLDGVDRFSMEDKSYFFGNVMLKTPSNVKFIIAARFDNSFKQRYLSDLSISCIDVKELCRDEIISITGKLLSAYGKRLSTVQMNKLISSKYLSNVFFLRYFIEELRVYSSFHKLDDQLTELTARKYDGISDAIKSSFNSMLDKLEIDYEINLVRCTLIAVVCHRSHVDERALHNLVRVMLGRAIFSDDEKAMLKSADKGDICLFDIVMLMQKTSFQGSSSAIPSIHYYKKYSDAVYDATDVYAVLQRMKAYFFRWGTKLKLYNDVFHKEICNRYFSIESTKEFYHALIADWLIKNEGDIPELAWQLYSAEQWDALHDLLKKTECFVILWSDDVEDVKNYWHVIINKTEQHPRHTYKNVLDNPESYSSECVLFLSRLFKWFSLRDEYVVLTKCYAGKNRELESNFQQKAKITKGGLKGAKLEIADHMERIESLKGEQDYAGALILAEERLMYYSHSKSHDALLNREIQNNLQLFLEQKAILFSLLGNHVELHEALLEQEQICRANNFEQSLLHNILNQAFSPKHDNSIKEAFDLFREAEILAKKCSDRNELMRSYIGMAGVFKKNQMPDRALEYFELAIQQKEWGNIKPNLLVGALKGKGDYLIEIGDIDTAYSAFKDAEHIARNYEMNEELADCLLNRAIILLENKSLDKALLVLKEAESMASVIRDDNRIALVEKIKVDVMLKQANDAINSQDLSVADELYDEIISISDMHGDQKSIALAKINKAIILRDRGEFSNALTLFLEQEQICRTLDFKHVLTVSLGNRGNLHHIRNEYDQALACYRESADICKSLSDYEHLLKQLLNQASILSDIDGEILIAEELVEEFDSIVSIHQLPRIERQMATTLDDLKARIYHKAVGINTSLGEEYSETGHIDDAIKCYKKVLNAAEFIYKKVDSNKQIEEWLGATYKTLGDLHSDIESWGDSITYLKRAIIYDKKVFLYNEDDLNQIANLADSIASCGRAYLNSFERNSAQKQFHEAIKLYEHLVEAGLATAENCRNLSVCYLNSALSYCLSENEEEAEAFFIKSEKLLTSLVTENPSNAEYIDLLEHCKSTRLKRARY